MFSQSPLAGSEEVLPVPELEPEPEPELPPLPGLPGVTWVVVCCPVKSLLLGPDGVVPKEPGGVRNLEGAHGENGSGEHENAPERAEHVRLTPSR